MAEKERSSINRALERAATTRSVGRVMAGTDWNPPPVKSPPQHQHHFHEPRLRDNGYRFEEGPQQRALHPPPPAKDDYLRPTTARQRPPQSGSVLAPPPTTSESGRSKKEQRSGATKQKNMLEDVLGIYPAENKLPPGRSAADDFAATIAKKFQFGRKNTAAAAAAQKRAGNEAQQPDEDAPSAPVEAIATTRGHLAELPGSFPEAPSRASSRAGGKTEPQKDQSKPRSRSRKGGKLELQAGPPNEVMYANMPLPAVPSVPPRRIRPITAETSASKYGVEITDWAESFFQEQQPRRGRSSSSSRPPSSRAPSLASSSTSSDYGARTSYGSSAGEPFRYETCDTGLGIIGEEAFYGDREIHLVSDDEDETGFNYYGSDDYEKGSARRPPEMEVRRGSTISTGSSVAKCALDYEIEAYLAELKRTQRSEVGEKKAV
jgi:hypothetical protein